MFFHYVCTESGKQVDPLILGRLSVEATQNVYNPERFTAEYLKAVANLGTVNQIAELMFNGNIEAAQAFKQKYASSSNYAQIDLPNVILGTADNYTQVERARTAQPIYNGKGISPLSAANGEKDAVTKSVDENAEKRYNNGTNLDQDNGGNDNGSEDAELLERGEISAAGRSGDTLRQQGENSQAVRGTLGDVFETERHNDILSEGGGSTWLSGGNFESSSNVGSGYGESFLRTLREKRPLGVDTKGRIVSKRNQERLADTVFKAEDGSIMVLYHWTPNKFDEFKYGDGVFHVGTLSASLSIKSQSTTKAEGYLKEIYVVSRHPLIIEDWGGFGAYNIARQLLEKSLLDQAAFDKIARMEGFFSDRYDAKANVFVRQYLKDLGFDSYLYQNGNEDTGAWSVGVFDADQIITVAENGVLKEEIGTENSSVLQSNANEAGKAPSKEASPTGGRVLDMPAITVRQQNYIRQVGKALGLNVEFVNMEKFLREHDVNTEGLKVYPDGAIDGKGNVYIAYNTKRALQFVFKHELTHFGERSKHYKAFVNVVRESKVYLAWLKATTKMENASREVMEAELMKRHREARNGLAKLSYDAAMNEIIADFVGEKCFGENLEDINELVSGVTKIKEKNAAVRFLHDFFLWLKNKLADHQLIRDEISLIEQNFAQMLADTDNTKTSVTQDGGLKYSIASDVVFSNYCDSIDKIENSDDISSKGQYIEVSQQTPSIIVEKANAKNLPMAIQFDIAYLETRHDGKLEGNYHSLGANNMKELPKLLETPEYIVRLKNGRLNVIVEMSTKKGERALVSIELEQAKQVNGKFNKYNLILTAFGTKTGYLERIVNNPENQILYDRKTEPQGTDQLHKGLDGINGSVSNNRVTQNNSAVNSNSMQNGLKYSVATDEQTDTPTDFPSQQKELFEKLQNGEISGGRVLDMPAITVRQQNYIRQVGKALGLNVEFVNMEKFLREHDVNTEGLKVYPDGAIDGKGNVYIAYNTKRALQFVFKHELTHFGERSKHYKAFVNVVRESKVYLAWLKATTKMENASREVMEAELMKRHREARNGLAKLSYDAAMNEIIADFVGEKCFGENLEDMNKLVASVKDVKERNTAARFLHDFFLWLKNKLADHQLIRDEISLIEQNFAQMLTDTDNTKPSTENGRGLKFIIAGESALTANKLKLSAAQRGVAFNKDSESVLKNTGWYMGKDGKWRFFIPDIDMVFERDKYLSDTHIGKSSPSLIGNYVKHDKLFAAYPELKNITLRFEQRSKSNHGKYNASSNEIVLNELLLKDEDKLKTTLIHELQHAVQYIEGFATGGNKQIGLVYALNRAYEKVGNLETFKNLPSKEEKYKYLVDVAKKEFNAIGYNDLRSNAYRAIYGEVEAREAGRKRNFDENMLKISSPDNYGNVIDLNTETDKFIENFQRMGYTEEEIKSVVGGIKYDQSRSDSADAERFERELVHLRPRRNNIGKSNVRNIGIDRTSQEKSEDIERGVHSEVSDSGGRRIGSDLRFSVETENDADTQSTDFTAKFKTLMQSFQNGEISGDEYAEEIELLWEKALEEAGEIKPGEKVSAENKDIPVPKSVKEGTKVRQHVRTILESGMATAQQEEWLKAHVLSGELSYTPTSDKKRIKDAENTISKLGYQIALNNWQSRDGGVGLGLERIVQNILGLDNIKQATAFPRDRDRIRP